MSAFAAQPEYWAALSENHKAYKTVLNRARVTVIQELVTNVTGVYRGGSAWLSLLRSLKGEQRKRRYHRAGAYVLLRDHSTPYVFVCSLLLSCLLVRSALVMLYIVRGQLQLFLFPRDYTLLVSICCKLAAFTMLLVRLRSVRTLPSTPSSPDTDGDSVDAQEVVVVLDGTLYACVHQMGVCSGPTACMQYTKSGSLHCRRCTCSFPHCNM
jgi:hypothetical protein